MDLKKETEEENNEIEIVMGDNSNLEISNVEVCVNDLRPKKNKTKKKKIVIPKTKNK